MNVNVGNYQIKHQRILLNQAFLLTDNKKSKYLVGTLKNSIEGNANEKFANNIFVCSFK